MVSGCVAEITGLSIFEKGGGFSSRVWAFSIVGEGHVVGDGVGQCVDGGVVDCGVWCARPGFAGGLPWWLVTIVHTIGIL